MFSALGLESTSLLLPSSWEQGAAMVGVAKEGFGLIYKLCGIAKSKYSNRSDLRRRVNELENIINQLKKVEVKVNILTGNIIYTNCKAIQNTHRGSQHYLRDIAKAKQSLIPLQKGQKGFDQNIISSVITSSPTNLIKVINRNPKEILSHIEEEYNATFKPQEDYIIPFWFQDKGILYKGWVKRGLLEVFGCKYNQLWLPIKLPTRFPYNLPTDTSSRYKKPTYEIPNRLTRGDLFRYRRLTNPPSNTSTTDISPKKSTPNIPTPFDQARYARWLNRLDRLNKQSKN